MTWNFNWNIIVNVTNYISVIKVKGKITVILDNVCSQVEIDSTFTAIARFVFNNKSSLQ